jgi:hypothetical protein
MPGTQVDLIPHPSESDPPALKIGAEVERSVDALDIRFAVDGDLADVAWPASAAAARADGLWRHTCFEAFCAVPGASAYYEFNFSPAGAWAAYRFGGYRERLADPELRSPPAITVRESTGAVRVDVRLDTAGLPRLAASAPFELALAAVIEARDARTHHFALAHPGEQPDFHDRRAFLVALPGFGRHRR